MNNTSFITFDILNKYKEINCAFSTRIGGYSSGSFTSQNMGNIKYDNASDVSKNRLNFYRNLEIDPSRIVLPGQTHSINIAVAEDIGKYSNIDALISNKQNLFLSIQTADCFPVFLYEPVQRVIGLIHAGWRGAVKGIIPKTINLMVNQFEAEPKKMNVVIGPGLQKECFEVRSDVFKLFSDSYYYSEHSDNSKRYLNLQAYIYDCLIESGIKGQNIEKQDACTKCCTSLYFSYRRDGARSGRMMGILGIRNVE